MALSNFKSGMAAKSRESKRSGALNSFRKLSINEPSSGEIFTTLENTSPSFLGSVMIIEWFATSSSKTWLGHPLALQKSSEVVLFSSSIARFTASASFLYSSFNSQSMTFSKAHRLLGNFMGRGEGGQEVELVVVVVKVVAVVEVVVVEVTEVGRVLVEVAVTAAVDDKGCVEEVGKEVMLGLSSEASMTPRDTANRNRFMKRITVFCITPVK